MKPSAKIPTGGMLLAGGVAFAVNFGEKPDTPKLPGVDYVVHDGTRSLPDAE